MDASTYDHGAQCVTTIPPGMVWMLSRSDKVFRKSRFSTLLDTDWTLPVGVTTTSVMGQSAGKLPRMPLKSQ